MIPSVNFLSGRSTHLLLAAAVGCIVSTSASAQGSMFEGRLRVKSLAGSQAFFLDIDGDGRRDQVRAGDDGDSSYFFAARNEGNSAFRTVIDHYFGGPNLNITDVSAGDIDGDGDRDAIYSLAGGAMIVVRKLGNGRFTSQSASEFVSGASGYIQLADIDGDGDLDLLSAQGESFAPRLRVFGNSGNGSFASGAAYVIGSQPSGLAVADLDHDGDLDAVTSSWNPPRVDVLLNDGTGTFAPSVAHATGAQPRRPFLVDVDGDGWLDIVVAETGPGTVGIARNMGNGVFANVASISTGPGCRSIDVADLNGDGFPDIAAENATASASVSVLLSAGGGNFLPVVTIATGASGGIGALDLDGDGDLDLALVGTEPLLNRGDGNFVAPGFDVSPSALWESQIETGDLDGDGRPDVAILSKIALEIRRNLGGNQFGAARIYANSPAVPSPTDLLLADLDGDGDLDVVMKFTNLPTIRVRFNDGSGTLSPTVTLPNVPVSVRSVAVADTSGDGIAEIIASTATGAWTSQYQAGSFGAWALVPGPLSPFPRLFADFDVDGRIDIVSADAQTIYLQRNLGGGNFSAAVPVGANATTSEFVFGDIDGDGDPDLATVSASTSSIHALRNDGTGSLSTPILLPVESGEFSTYGATFRLAIVDLDHDGDGDVMCTSVGLEQYAIVFENLGGTNFAPPQRVGTAGAVALSAADVDGDGDDEWVCCDYQRFFRIENISYTGFAFCVGDGSATACPCGNASLPGAESGCTNSSGRAGKLTARGSASLVHDTLVLRGNGMANSYALYFQGTSGVNGGNGSVFGDGLRCAGGTVVRIGITQNVLGISAWPASGAQPLSLSGNVSAPGERFYQVWYRDAPSFCSPATSNLTNGLRVTWQL